MSRAVKVNPLNDPFLISKGPKDLVFNTRKGKILYSEDSLKRLLNNDSLKYEKSMSSVVKEFMEQSSKSYYLIGKKSKMSKGK